MWQPNLCSKTIAPQYYPTEAPLAIPTHSACCRPYLLPFHSYCTYVQIEAGGNVFGSLPQLHPGVACLLREFDSLQLMSERESVAVPFLRRHHFMTMSGQAYDGYMQQLAANPMTPMPPDDHFLVAAGNPGELQQKVDNIWAMVNIYLDTVHVVAAEAMAAGGQQHQQA